MSISNPVPGGDIAQIVFNETASANRVVIVNPTGSAITPDAGSTAQLQILNSLVPGVYDYISLAYDTSSNLTGAAFKSGGAGGTVVSTLLLGYSGSTLTSVTKS